MAIFQVVEKLTTVICNIRFYRGAYKNTTLDNKLSQFNLILTLTQYLCKFHFTVLDM